MSPYPRWRFFPSFAPAPAWVAPLTLVFSEHQAKIDSQVVHATRVESDAVLRVIADDLEAIGYSVERGKKKMGKLPRPVFFGERLLLLAGALDTSLSALFRRAEELARPAS